MSKQTLKVVKIGGNIINNDTVLHSFLKDFSEINEPKILVHGGGKKASEIAISLGLEQKILNGRRITDKPTLDVVTMVYAGLLNKNIVAKLQSFGCNAIGMSGADGNSIKAHKRVVETVDYGYVGDVEIVNSEIVDVLLQNNVTPVFCAITHDKNGQLLNTNADTIASEIAIGMSNLYCIELNYIFELKGVLATIKDENSVIIEINSEKHKQLIQQGIIVNGMLPKMENCFNALKKGVEKVKIGNVSLLDRNNKLYSTLSL